MLSEDKKSLLKEVFPEYNIIKIDKPKRSKYLRSASVLMSSGTLQYWIDSKQKIIFYL